MARWGMADDGEVLELAGHADVVESVWAHAAPPMGMVWHEQCPPGGSVVRRVEVDADADGRIDVLVDGRHRAGGVDAVESELALFAAERLRGLVAVHAAVLRVFGDVVVVPGPSYSGKSTWCAAALDAGHEVWSDEFALVDGDGVVRGWPRALRLRTPTGAVRRDLGPTPSVGRDGVHAVVGVGARVGDRDGARVSMVAAVAHGARLDVHELAESAAITAVLSNTVCAQRRPDESFAAAVRMVRGARCVGGTRGESGDAVRWLVEALSSPRPSHRSAPGDHPRGEGDGGRSR